LHENECKSIDSKSELILKSKLDKLSINKTKEDLIKSINESICLYYINLEMFDQKLDVNDLKKFCEKIQISKDDKLLNSKNIIFKCPIELDLNISLLNKADLNGEMIFMYLIALSGLLKTQNLDNESNNILPVATSWTNPRTLFNSSSL
jgi:hypothetical protein